MLVRLVEIGAITSILSPCWGTVTAVIAVFWCLAIVVVVFNKLPQSPLTIRLFCETWGTPVCP
jgi:hypothetical protein